MTNEPARCRLQITVDSAKLATIDSFQRQENLTSRAEAVRLLLDIALDTISGRGRRFWDAPQASATERRRAKREAQPPQDQPPNLQPICDTGAPGAAKG